MNIAIEVNHPAQVHLIKYLYHNLSNRHKIFVFAKKDKHINSLLIAYNIPYTCIGTKGKGIIGKLFKQFIFDLIVLRYVLKEKIEIAIGSSITFDHIAFLCSIKSFHLSDDDLEVVPLLKYFSYPFSTVILSPDSLSFGKFKNKNIGYAGTHELAYLHPNYFSPDSSILNKAGIETDDKFFILRFVALLGHHDSGHIGISLDQKRQLVAHLSKYGRVIITSEKKIEPEFEELRLPIPPHEIHSLMAYATMFIGDSQTMTSEAAILGVPALKCNSFAGRLSVPNELENKYDLCYSYHPKEFDKFYKHISDLLVEKELKQEWQAKRNKMLNDKIDVTAFLVWFIENYPQSAKIMKENPNYQYNFK